MNRREIITGAAVIAAYGRLSQAQSVTPQIGGGISKGFDGGISGPTSSASAWTPASFGAPLIGWWDASNVASLTFNGGSVSAAADLSGKGNTVSQGTAINQPVYNATGLNGKGIFVAASSALQKTSFAMGGTVVTVFAVAKETAGSSARVVSFAAGGNDLAATAFIAPFFNTVTNPADYNNGIRSNGAVVSGSWNQYCSVFDGTNNTLYIGGVAQTPVGDVTSFAATGTLTLMANQAIGNSMTGGLAEVFMINAVPSAGDRASAQAYLSSKWGV